MTEQKKTFIGLMVVLTFPIILGLYVALLSGALWLAVFVAKVLLRTLGV